MCYPNDLKKGNNLFKQDMENLVNDSEISLYPTLRIEMQKSCISDLTPLEKLKDLGHLTLLDL